ncbi:hypothetical protein LWI28_011841 [Acer negundo]|uniref:Transposase MuDR plant domain-containing protein n=1 Tax=Acer negundo TaxID=4023 RepID=A0AAD5I5Y5_ACENE|nr:hypothetical protein LWI28_011841 [Acer negundo]
MGWEHEPVDVDEQWPSTIDGVNWAENHGPATVYGPHDVELHRPSDVNWTDNVVHVRVNKEAGNKDKGKHVLEEGQAECEAQGLAKVEVEVEVEDILVESDYEQEADDIAAETYVDQIKIWDSLNVPNIPHEECASGSDIKDVYDELNSLDGSDGEKGEQGRVRKFIHRSYNEFHPERDMHDPEFKVGMLFGTADIFRKAIRAHAVKHMRDVNLKKNDQHRVRAVCKSEACNWFVYASWLSDHKTFRIKTLCIEHPCSMSFKNKFVNSKLITEKYVDQWRVNLDWNYAGMSAQLRIDTIMDASNWQFYRARKTARQMIDGGVKDQYSKLREYIAEVMRMNPDTTIILKCDYSGRFKKMYICLGALKQRWKQGCMPLLGLDECFTKGYHIGQLLIAIGVDPNN